MPDAASLLAITSNIGSKCARKWWVIDPIHKYIPCIEQGSDTFELVDGKLVLTNHSAVYRTTVDKLEKGELILDSHTVHKQE